MPIDLYPTVCNICGGHVIYVSNAEVYHGRQYGSGYCYLCVECGAYVGTHKPRPREALGLLADAKMRKGKMMCHAIFDSKWQGQTNPIRKRRRLYAWLARKLDIPLEDCHFGYFDLPTLRRAYEILLEIKDEPLKYNHKGEIIN